MPEKNNKFDQLIKEIEKMSVLELNEFIKKLEEKFGIEALQFQAPAGTVSQTQDQEAKETAPSEEKSLFSIELQDAGSNKIQVIKLVKDLTGKGLKESKDIVEGELPVILKENVVKEEAEQLKKKFEEAGAKVLLK